MKKITLLLGVVFLSLVLPVFSNAKLDRDCFVNWTQVACGLENQPPDESFCKNVKLEVLECYNDGDDFYATFRGIENFTIKELYRGLTFDLYSRAKVWRGSIAITSPEAGFDVLPEGAVISKKDGEYMFYAPIGNYSITGFKVTVPYCYRVENSDGEKIYPRTQAGKSCYTKKPEVIVEKPQQEEETEDKFVSEQSIQKTGAKENNWQLVILFATIIIATILLLRLFISKKKLKNRKR